MIRSWFSRLMGRREDGIERRTETPPPVMEIEPGDIDPVTGALCWERFQAMFDAEQAQAPGVLLLIDLSTRSNDFAVTSENEAEILPWLAEAIRQGIRANDLLAHVDGYRFAALLRGAPQEQGDAISRRILESVGNTIFMTDAGIARIGVAIGGAMFGQDAGNGALDAAVANLDAARNSNMPLVIQ